MSLAFSVLFALKRKDINVSVHRTHTSYLYHINSKKRRELQEMKRKDAEEKHSRLPLGKIHIF